MSQSHSKSKEKLKNVLPNIFAGFDLQVSLENHEDILKPLAEPEENPKFLYKPPVWDYDNNGMINLDENQSKIMLEPPRDPFHSPCIIAAFKNLWFGRNSRWNDVPMSEVTASQLAFVCGLVRYI